MSQVKNLRAMFEQRGESSPPDRGRTPGQSPTGSKASDSPRPLSRVRTNFIAIVEKDGRIGLHRDPSTDSAVSQSRKTAGGSEEVLSTPIQQENPVFWRTPPRQTVPALVSEQPKSLATTPSVKATTPEPASLPTPESLPAITPAGTGEVKAVKRDPVVPAAAEKPTNKAPKKVLGKALEIKPSVSTPAKAKPAASTTANGATNNNAKHTSSAASKPTAQPTAGHTAPATPKTTNGQGDKDKDKDAHRAAAAAVAIAAAAAAAIKFAPKTINTKVTAKAPKKSPTLSKTPSPTKHTAPKPHSKTPEKKAPTIADKAAAATPRSTASTAGKSTVPSSAKKPSTIHATPSNGTGFVKPKPKSPTRPVHLPAGLTTHTAASATKANLNRQSLSSMSGNFNQTHAATVRSASRMSGTNVAAAAPPHRLRRQNSTINRPRPSIGPPPKQPAHDHPVLRKEKEVDEGFLARMMRPTQASASKTIDKAHTPQARKQATSPARRPVTRKSPVATKKSVDTHQKETAVSSTKASVPAAIATDAAKPTPQINPVDPTPTEEVHPVNVAEEAPAAATQQAETDGSAPADSPVEAADSVTSEQAPTEGTEADSTAVETVDAELESTETKVSLDAAPENEDVKSAQVVEAPVPAKDEGMDSVAM